MPIADATGERASGESDVRRKTAMPDQRKYFGHCPFCEAGCGLEITRQGQTVQSIKGDAANPFSRGAVCPKCLSLIDLYNDPDRLRYPLKRTGDAWRPIGWDEAFAEIGKRIKAIREEHGRDAVALFLGNPNVHYHGNLFYLGLLLRALKTRNRYSSSSLDQLPLMMTCYLMFGHQLLFPVPDIDRTDYFLLIGANPAVSGGSIMTGPGIGKRIKAIRERNGKVVVIDPIFTKTAALADRHYFIRPGTDLFLLAAMVNTLFAQGLARPGRLAAFSDGIENVQRAVEEFTPEKVSAMTGIGAADIKNLTLEFATADKAVCYGRLGTCTQAHGALSNWLILAFNIISGKMDRPGGFMFPTPALDLVRFTALAGEKGWVGRHHTRVSGLADFAGEFPVAALAEEILTPGRGRIRAMVTIAGNPVLSAPNGRLMDKALANLDFMVAVDWYINESTRHAHIILPPTTPLEHANHTMMVNLAGVRNFAGYAEPVFEKEPGTRHNWEILSALTAQFVKNPVLKAALRLLKPELLLAGFLRFGPHGAGLKFWRPGLTLSRLKAERHGIDLGPLTPRLPERLFTKDKRLRLAPEIFVSALQQAASGLAGPPAVPVPPFDLLLIGRRNRLSNNSWFHNFSRMRKATNSCTLLVHPEDAAKAAIRTGDRVRVSSSVGSITLAAEVTDRIMPGVVSIPHGWGHHLPGVRLGVASRQAGVSINDITDQRQTDLSGTAVFSGVPVRIEKE